MLSDSAPTSLRALLDGLARRVTWPGILLAVPVFPVLLLLQMGFDAESVRMESDGEDMAFSATRSSLTMAAWDTCVSCGAFAVLTWYRCCSLLWSVSGQRPEAQLQVIVGSLSTALACIYVVAYAVDGDGPAALWAQTLLALIALLSTWTVSGHLAQRLPVHGRWPRVLLVARDMAEALVYAAVWLHIFPALYAWSDTAKTALVVALPFALDLVMFPVRELAGVLMPGQAEVELMVGMGAASMCGMQLATRFVLASMLGSSSEVALRALVLASASELVARRTVGLRDAATRRVLCGVRSGEGGDSQERRRRTVMAIFVGLDQVLELSCTVIATASLLLMRVGTGRESPDTAQQLRFAGLQLAVELVGDFAFVLLAWPLRRRASDAQAYVMIVRRRVGALARCTRRWWRYTVTFVVLNASVTATQLFAPHRQLVFCMWRTSEADWHRALCGLTEGWAVG